MVDERYPIGKFEFTGEITKDVVKTWIEEIEELPELLRSAVKNMNMEQLATPYRLGGWTVRQVIHHLADSHMNAYIRIKLALTEENPTIKPYQEEKWAELPDSKSPINVSLELLTALHKRLVQLLRSLSPNDLKKTFLHPESGEVSVGRNIGMYAWHGRHHLAHITSLTSRKGWLDL
ncbi:YfiT family bacillithiol transferase [Bacillus sp. ISL-18]|uniref:YfiT family bacillithiol transferase n=1 Tax=Bacillus sp. ISL-18 TaxID=2819118 RepID=UPI0027E0A736|nr:bacillithiol transferase BstA [Bacillus sp. ISL-18]